MTVDVTVVLPCHNYGQWVREALDSVLAQTVTPKEIVVIDDGSTDETPRVLATVEERAKAGEFSCIVSVLRQENRGLSATLNSAVAAATTKYVAFVSADDRALNRFLEALVGALDRDQKAAFAYGKMSLFGDEEGIYLTFPYSPGRLIFDHNYIPGAAVVRRDAYTAVGGIRNLEMHEDWDLWLAFAEAGYRGAYVPEVLYAWRRHASARNHQPVRRKLLLRVRVLASRPRLLARYAHLALPWTAWSVWRRLRPRLTGRGPVRGPSCWLEPGSSQ